MMHGATKWRDLPSCLADGRRKLVGILLLSCLVIVTVVVTMRGSSQPGDVDALVRKRGAPTLWAQAVTLEYWDPNSSAVIRSRQLTVTRPRDWTDVPTRMTNSVIVYCDNKSFLAYWEMFRDGELFARTRATVALGESVTAVCYEIDPDERVVDSWTAKFTFAQFVK